MLLDTKRWTMPEVVPFEGDTIEALKFAIIRIETMGWSADNRQPGPLGPKPCAQRSITAYWPTHADFLLGRCDEALGYFGLAVGCESIVEWSEAPGRTIQDVLCGLHRALDLARRRVPLPRPEPLNRPLSSMLLDCFR